MVKKNKQVELKLLFNYQLKERNQHLTLELKAYYRLRCQHKMEQDLLVLDWQATKSSRDLLTSQQAQEWRELKQQCTDKRADLLQQHSKEKALLDRRLDLTH
ncbi:hypothetical protein [Spirosoma endophyticum]|uniref:Uncharacterized protein n=1 Tax=Spirosoma endophyticum TaxID=662367 RepID=A0A1I2EAW9_9BACT|nr:hypothetical protein [Spirosoma endophyticum]SFE90005.1 hypothetical protein SAMN05216167_12194 [Spirosoma endophyticum]